MGIFQAVVVFVISLGLSSSLVHSSFASECTTDFLEGAEATWRVSSGFIHASSLTGPQNARAKRERDIIRSQIAEYLINHQQSALLQSAMKEFQEQLAKDNPEARD